MTVPPDQPAEHDGSAPDPAAPELDFDPYRFGAPEHPVPPEYAPPGYRPPPEQQQPPASYPTPPPYAPQGQPAGYTPPQYRPSPPPPGQYGAPPPGQYAMPPGQYGVYYGPPPQRRTGKAVASMVLGIGSIVLSILSILDAVLIILAIIFGILALGESKRSPYREGRGMAIAGLACAAVGAVLAILLTTLYVHISKECDQYQSGTSQYQDCVRNHI